MATTKKTCSNCAHWPSHDEAFNNCRAIDTKTDVHTAGTRLRTSADFGCLKFTLKQEANGNAADSLKV